MVNKIISNKRKARVRKKLKKSSSDKMRLSVFRSAKHIYAQIIDDDAQSTICAASTLDKDLRQDLKGDSNSCTASTAVGKLVAERALAKGIQKVVFDRGGKLYHGRVKALATAAREAGLQF